MNCDSFRRIQSIILAIISIAWYFMALVHSTAEWIIIPIIILWQIGSILWLSSHIDEVLTNSVALMVAADEVSKNPVIQFIWTYSKLINWLTVGSIWICSCAAYQHSNWTFQYASTTLMILAIILTGIKLGFLVKKLHSKAMMAALSALVIFSTTSCSVGPNSDDLEDHRAQVSTSIRYQAEMANEDYDCGIEDNWLDVMQSRLDSMKSFESMDSLKSSYEKEIHNMIEFQKVHINDSME